MGTFSASLKTLGDRRGLPATISLEDDVLSITAGDQEIGSWNLDEITLEPTPAGYRMGAEGEKIMIDLPDKDAFAEELSQRDKKGGRLRLRRKEKVPAKTKSKKSPAKPERPHSPVTYQMPAAPPPAAVEPRPIVASPSEPAQRSSRLTEARAPSADVSSDQVKPKPTQKKPSLTERIDGLLETAEKRWGSLMPTWFFTRLMFYIVVGAFLLMLIFPGAVSSFLLAAGMLMVVFGAIIYTDDVLASKWLPGRMNPTHVLIFGVAILMFGVLLGVIAS
jgi:hypothetical protein